MVHLNNAKLYTKFGGLEGLGEPSRYELIVSSSSLQIQPLVKEVTCVLLINQPTWPCYVYYRLLSTLCPHLENIWIGGIQTADLR